MDNSMCKVKIAENPQDASVQPSLIDASLIPNESIIDEKYKNKLDVETEQSVVNFWMQKTRERNMRAQAVSQQPSTTNRANNGGPTDKSDSEEEAFMRSSIYSRKNS